jgi:hypothetical protein
MCEFAILQEDDFLRRRRCLASNCTANTIKQFLQGKIPDYKGDDGPDVVCEVDEGPFGLRECLRLPS